MSDSNRGERFALGLVAGIAVAIAVGYFMLWAPTEALQDQIELRGSKHAQQYQDSTYIAADCIPAEIPGPSSPHCITAETEAAREAERNERDLEAQQTMALWTQAMGKAAILGTGVGIVGLFLIFVTFWETRKAAAAGRMANDLARSQQRARLLPFARFERVAPDSQMLILACENVGVSHASNVRAAFEVCSDVPAHLPSLSDWGERHIVKANSEIDLTVVRSDVLQKRVIGIITYDTVFEKGLETYICYRFEFSKLTKAWYAVDCAPETWPADT